MNVVVVQTGTANTASVLAALRRAGAEPELSQVPDTVARAGHVVLPGVGAFAAARGALSSQLAKSLIDRLAADKPTLGICLGLQLLLQSSEESPNVEGLGIVPGRATRFSNNVRVPQLGWNQVTVDAECSTLSTGYAYFANSYRLVDRPDGWSCGITEHDGSFVSALERGNVVACQFHPELSGRWGHELITRWLETC